MQSIQCPASAWSALAPLAVINLAAWRCNNEPPEGEGDFCLRHHSERDYAAQ